MNSVFEGAERTEHESELKNCMNLLERASQTVFIILYTVSLRSYFDGNFTSFLMRYKLLKSAFSGAVNSWEEQRQLLGKILQGREKFRLASFLSFSKLPWFPTKLLCVGLCLCIDNRAICYYDTHK